MATTENSFSAPLRRGLYEAVFRRRDMREFLGDPVPDEILARVLTAAHHAASVGFTQPWDFIFVKDVERRRRVKQIFEEEHAKNAAQFGGERKRKFLSFKLEGILEASVLRLSAELKIATSKSIPPAWRLRISGSPRGPKDWAW